MAHPLQLKGDSKNFRASSLLSLRRMMCLVTGVRSSKRTFHAIFVNFCSHSQTGAEPWTWGWSVRWCLWCETPQPGGTDPVQCTGAEQGAEEMLLTQTSRAKQAIHTIPGAQMVTSFLYTRLPSLWSWQSSPHFITKEFQQFPCYSLQLLQASRDFFSHQNNLCMQADPAGSLIATGVFIAAMIPSLPNFALGHSWPRSSF